MKHTTSLKYLCITVMLCFYYTISIAQSATDYQQANTFVNPVLPGDHPDPTLLKVGKDFYMCGSSFHFTPFLPILHSTDLIHWETIGRAVSPTWNGLASGLPGAGIWQGAITYFYGSYWIYFSNGSGSGQYFTKAVSPAGPWSTPVKVKGTATTGAIGYDNSIFVDDDSTAYMLIKAGKYVNNIQKIASSGNLSDTLINLSWMNATGKYSWAEGPVMCKRNGWYYYFIAGNVGGGQWTLRSQTLTSDSTKWQALGTFFQPITDPLVGLKAPNHTSQPIQLADSTWWVIAHSYESFSGNDWSGQGRQGILYQVLWDANGKPTAVSPTSVPASVPMLPNTNKLRWLLPLSDYFEGSVLNSTWHFLNKTTAASYSLSNRSGWLSLLPSTNNKTHILQKEGGHYYTLVTKVDLNATKNEQQGGLYLTNGDDSLFAKVCIGYNKGLKFFFSLGTTNYEATDSIGSIAWLKLDRKEHLLTAYFSGDGLNWTQIGSAISAINLDKAQANYNSWVGNSIGLFAQDTTASFDHFVYKDGFSDLPISGFNNYCGVSTTKKTIGSVVTNSTSNGGWLLLGGVDFGDCKTLIPSLVSITASSILGGNVEVWIDDIENNGVKIATVPISSTGSVDTWKIFSSSILAVSGQHDVYLRFPKVKSSFYLHTIKFISANTLPIKRNIIKAIKKGNAVLINCTISSVHNTVAYYELQRSIDGIRYLSINKINIPANGFFNDNYSFWDYGFSNKDNFYRLKEIDFNNTTSYSNSVLVSMLSSQGKLLVYPSPTTASLKINIEGLDDRKTLVVNISDVNGRNKYSEQGQLSKINAELPNCVAKLDAGIYFISTNVNGKINSERFVKE